MNAFTIMEFIYSIVLSLKALFLYISKLFANRKENKQDHLNKKELRQSQNCTLSQQILSKWIQEGTNTKQRKNTKSLNYEYSLHKN